jgi:hypothetical protein
MHGIKQKWRENIPLNPRQKLSTNQNAPFNLTWIKGPTKIGNRLRIDPSHAQKSPARAALAKAEVGWS